MHRKTLRSLIQIVWGRVFDPGKSSEAPQIRGRELIAERCSARPGPTHHRYSG